MVDRGVMVTYMRINPPFPTHAPTLGAASKKLIDLNLAITFNHWSWIGTNGLCINDKNAIGG
jgi:hypothetical protein